MLIEEKRKEMTSSELVAEINLNNKKNERDSQKKGSLPGIDSGVMRYPFGKKASFSKPGVIRLEYKTGYNSSKKVHTI